MRIVLPTRLRGIHTAVVAVIVAIVMIAVGIAIISGVVAIGKHASKKGALEVLGTPVITAQGGQVSLTVKNIGTDTVVVKEVHVVYSNTDYKCTLGGGNGISVAPGQTQDISCQVKSGNRTPNLSGVDVVSGYLVTNYGTLTVNFVVVS